MRMWMINPRLLCPKHLCGEHYEIHMLAGHLRAGHSIQGYLDRGLIEPQSMETRHEELAAEMVWRGGKHQSPLTIDFEMPRGEVSRGRSFTDLAQRCPACVDMCVKLIDISGPGNIWHNKKEGEVKNEIISAILLIKAVEERFQKEIDENPERGNAELILDKGRLGRAVKLMEKSLTEIEKCPTK